jgi:HD superfamily phosphohydrolase
VYSLFHVRYKLYKNYYFNVVSQSIEMMISDILNLTKEDLKIQEACNSIYKDPTAYLKLNDNIIDKIENIYERLK